MSRIAILCMWVSVLILNASSIDIGSNKVQKVIATGLGINENQAIKNASKAAIQQVVGMYVVSDVLMKNSKLIKDKVLTQSNAYIKSFKPLNKTKNEDGLFEVEAVVEVEVGKLTRNLGKINIATKNVGTSEFKATALTSFSSSREFKAMIHKVVMGPIYENKKIYDIEVNSFKLFPNEMHLNWVYWARGDGDLYKVGELFPFELSFTLGLNDNYIHSIMNFFEHSSEQSSDFYIDNKNAIHIHEVTATDQSSRHLLGHAGKMLKTKKSYLLSPQNKKVFNANAKIKNTNFSLRISLMDKNNEAIKSYNYPKTIFSKNQSTTGILIKKKFNYKKEVFYPARIKSSSALLSGFFTGQNLYLRPCLGFITNKQELVTYLFLNEDEASRVSRVTIETHWNK